MNPTVSPVFRRVVLGCAFALALIVALPSRPPAAYAQPAPPPAPGAPAIPAPPAAPAAPASTAAEPASAAQSAPDKRHRTAIEITARVRDNAAGASAEDTGKDAAGQDRSVVIEKGGRRVHVRGLGADRDYDSVGEMVDKDPEIAGMVIGVVAIVFLTPVLIIIAVMSYRMRKARMLNETLLKLAERGVAPPAELMQAVASGDAAQALAASPSTAPLLQQAQTLRRRAAWSDLRKGVILGGLGIAFSVHGLFEERSPGMVGLILLFLGVAYGVLWWFENKQPAPGTPATPGGPAAPGSGA